MNRMGDFTVVNGGLVLPDAIIENASITVSGDRIAAVGEPPGPGAETVDAGGGLVLPGLIDIHTHGRLGFPDPARAAADLAQDCASLPSTGVTRFLPTLASAPLESWHAVLEAMAASIDSPPPGAVPMGVHLEGVFLNPEAAGAHPGNLIVPFDPSNPLHSGLFEKYGDLIKLVSFAPEVAGNERIIGFCRERGIVMSLGHSAATPAQVRGFTREGVRHMTHLFNGMKVMDHRDPGPALAGLLEDDVSVELICDGFHVHPEIVKLVHRTKAPNKRVLITDSFVLDIPGIEAGGDDEPNRLPNGRFAGSRLRLMSAVRNYVEFTGCPLFEAVAMASLYPARLLGMDEVLGSLESGKIADLWIADRDLIAQSAYVGGRKVF